MTRLRVGIAGCGAIARQVHIPLLHAHDHVALVAVADRDERALAAVADRHRGVRPYGDVQEMVGSAGLDAVVVALPPALHAGAACAAFDAGLHLYLEKPMAATLEESAAIVRAWRRSGKIAVMGFNVRANPLLVRLRDLLRAGRAGTPVYLQTFLSSGARSLPDWKRQRGSGGGALLDLGVHHIDLVRFLTGREIIGVRASMSSRLSEHDTILLELRLDDGIGAHLFFSLAAAEGDHVEVHGDLARLMVDRYTSLDVRIIDNLDHGYGVLGRAARRVTALRQLGRALHARRSPLREPGYALLLDRFVRASLHGVAPREVPDLTDGFRTAAAVAAAEESLKTGLMETPSPLPDSAVPRLQATP